MVEEKRDRLSNLPDELLCHTLSFLTTKEAALTSNLSKRWRNLFAFVPNIDINDSVFLHPEKGKRERDGALQSFMDFVDRVLDFQGDSPIKKFSLKCQNGVDPDRVNRWICNVLQRGVIDMALFIDLGRRYELPSEIFMSRTLVDLRIGGVFSIKLDPGHISLPMLRTLALDKIWSYNSDQLQMLLSGCPALEELDLSNIHWSYGEEIVSSSSLRTLTIDSFSYYLHTFSLDTPNLVCLKYSESVASNYPLLNLENLVEARLEIRLRYDPFKKPGQVQKLVRGICNVQKLYLSPGALQVFAIGCQAMPTFNKLTFLDIDGNNHEGWRAMLVLLRNCPQLETLVIKGGLLHYVSDPREDTGRSLASCPVKRLEIRSFEGTTSEMIMIKHFYDYFPLLKEMDIHVN